MAREAECLLTSKFAKIAEKRETLGKEEGKIGKKRAKLAKRENSGAKSGKKNTKEGSFKLHLLTCKSGYASFTF